MPRGPYLGPEDENEDDRRGQLTAGEFQEEQVVRMLLDPGGTVQEDRVHHRGHELEQNTQKEAPLLAVVAGRVAGAVADVQTADQEQKFAWNETKSPINSTFCSPKNND